MNDRRDFFKTVAEKSAQEFLKQFPRIFRANSSELQNSKQLKLKKLISSGEPINNSGIPFGGFVSGMVIIPKNMNSYLLIVSHSAALPNLGYEWAGAGLTQIEFSLEENGRCFFPNYNSSETKRFTSKDVVICDGIEEKGPEFITHLELDENFRVHASEKSGSKIEYNVRTGMLLRQKNVHVEFHNSEVAESVSVEFSNQKIFSKTELLNETKISSLWMQY